MNLNNRLALVYLDKVGALINKNKDDFSDVSMIICPPYTTLDLMSSVLFEASEGIFGDDNLGDLIGLQLGAQNVNHNNDGAYTGEISTNMLNEYGVEWVILGHSERRSLFNESNTMINLKIKRAIESGIKPILCIGESSEERSAGQTESILNNQIKECLKDIDFEDDFLIAYEPIWAIGTGETADNDTIKLANNIILSIIGDLSSNIKKPKILYGGSVNNNNSENLSKICNLDGFLIGGASLDVNQFYSIYNALKGE